MSFQGSIRSGVLTFAIGTVVSVSSVNALEITVPAVDVEIPITDTDGAALSVTQINTALQAGHLDADVGAFSPDALSPIQADSGDVVRLDTSAVTVNLAAVGLTIPVDTEAICLGVRGDLLQSPGGATDHAVAILGAGDGSVDVCFCDIQVGVGAVSITVPVLGEVSTPELAAVTLQETGGLITSSNGGAACFATANVVVAAGFTLSEPDGNTAVNETGSTDTLEVVLDQRPLSDVVIDLSSADTGEASVSPTSMTFTPSNWDTPQSATVMGVNDPTVDGDQTIQITASVDDGHSDDAFDSLDDQSIDVAVGDNDVVGFLVSETGGSTAVYEDGSTDTLALVLEAQPLTDVVIDVSSTDTTEATVSPASVTFTSANWNVSQTVTLTGVDDSIDDGDQSTQLTASIDDAVSDDAFDSIVDQTIQVTTVDDETSDTTAPTIESSNTATVAENTTAVMTLAADESVAWSLSGGVDQGRFTLSGSALAFSTAPDFENPSDDDTNNEYVVKVTATDAAGNTSTEDLAVTVLDVDEPRLDDQAPTISGFTRLRVESGTPMPASQYAANEPVTWSLSAMDAALFSISSDGRLTMNEIPSIEQPSDHDRDNRFLIAVVAEDDANNRSTLSVIVDMERGNPIVGSPPVEEIAQSSIEDAVETAAQTLAPVTDRLVALQRGTEQCAAVSKQGLQLDLQNAAIRQFASHAGLLDWFNSDVCDLFADDSAVWSAGTLVLGSREGASNALDLDIEIRQLTVGYDRRVSADWVAGAAVSVSNKEAGYADQSSEVKSDSVHLKLYGQRELDTHSHLSAVVGLGVFTLETLRRAESVAYQGTREAFQVVAQLGYDYRISKAEADAQWSVFVDGDASVTHFDAYTETGGLNPLTYQDQIAVASTVKLGVSGERTWMSETAQWSPRLEIGVKTTYQDARDLRVCYADETNTTFTAPYESQFTQAFDLGVGLRIQSGQSLWDMLAQWTKDTDGGRFQTYALKYRRALNTDPSTAFSWSLISDHAEQRGLGTELTLESRF